MTAHAIQHFDALGYVDRSKSLGLDENLAKYQARQMEEILKIAANNNRAETEAKELASKKDLMEVKGVLRLEIQKAKFEIIITNSG